MTNDNLPDVSPAPLDDPTPGHRAPPPGWRPLSGLALTMFIVSLIVGVISVPLGLWWAPALCLVLSVIAYLRADPKRVRGRGFAVSGMVLSVMTGLIAYWMISDMREQIEFIASDVCHAFDADVSEAEGLERIQAWLKQDGAVEKDETEGEKPKPGAKAHDIAMRFRLLEARMGAFKQALPPVSMFGGTWRVFAGPDDPSLREISDPEEAPPALTAGELAMWGKAEFERGEVQIAFFLMKNASIDNLKKSQERGTRRAPMFRDMRFYVLPVAK